MSQSTLAVFPLSLIETSLRFHKQKGIDRELADKFGYKRATKMYPSVRYSEPPSLRYVHCGALPLAAVVRVGWSAYFSMGRTCYINTAGEHVYPA